MREAGHGRASLQVGTRAGALRPCGSGRAPSWAAPQALDAATIPAGERSDLADQDLRWRVGAMSSPELPALRTASARPEPEDRCPFLVGFKRSSGYLDGSPGSAPLAHMSTKISPPCPNAPAAGPAANPRDRLSTLHIACVTCTGRLADLFAEQRDDRTAAPMTLRSGRRRARRVSDRQVLTTSSRLSWTPHHRVGRTALSVEIRTNAPDLTLRPAPPSTGAQNVVS